MVFFLIEKQIGYGSGWVEKRVGSWCGLQSHRYPLRGIFTFIAFASLV